MGTILFSIAIALVSFSSKANECSKYQEYQCPGGKTYPIHLTFDDGPHVKNTPKVLDALDKHNIKATFFVVGSNLVGDSRVNQRKKIEIMNRIKNSGHPIGSHSFKHELHTKLSDSELERYIRKSRETLEEYLTEPNLFRLPYGDGWHPLTVNKPRAQAVMSEIKRQNFSHVGWSLDADDWDRGRQRNPGILAIMMDQICENKGGVVLLHDIQTNTADNIDEWISALKCMGHQFSPISDFYGSHYIQMAHPIPNEENITCTPEGTFSEIKLTRELSTNVESVINLIKD